MKFKSLTMIVFLSLNLSCFMACQNSDPKVWDIYPTIILISVEDSQGNDMLNTSIEGNIANSGIRAIYKERIFEKDSIVYDISRAYMARLRGLQTDSLINGKYVLSFGEFNGDDNFKNEKIVIDWNDGTQDTIAFDSKFSWKNKKPSVKRKYYLNGEETEHPIKIIK